MSMQYAFEANERNNKTQSIDLTRADGHHEKSPWAMAHPVVVRYIFVLIRSFACPVVVNVARIESNPSFVRSFGSSFVCSLLTGRIGAHSRLCSPRARDETPKKGRDLRLGYSLTFTQHSHSRHTTLSS